jgi:hypothetical protein
MKEEFLKLLRSTNREGVEDLITWLEKSDFFTSPASCQYHGSYQGGLLEHSLNVYFALEYLYNNLKDSEEYHLPQLNEESIIISALLHDICKANCYVESTRNVKNEQTGQWEKVPFYKREPLFPMGHGGKSVFICQQFIKLTPTEAQAIFWHMGPYDISNYNTLNELGSTYDMNLLAFLLNQADMMATYIMENQRYIGERVNEKI